MGVSSCLADALAGWLEGQPPKAICVSVSDDLSSIVLGGEILDNHELRSKLPDDSKFSKFVVDLTNVCHSPDLLAYLHNHPRVKEVIYEDDDF